MTNKNEFYFWEEMWNGEKNKPLKKEEIMNEKEIESILYKCHAENIASEVMEMAIEIQRINPKISKLESYERSYIKVKSSHKQTFYEHNVGTPTTDIATPIKNIDEAKS